MAREEDVELTVGRNEDVQNGEIDGDEGDQNKASVDDGEDDDEETDGGGSGGGEDDPKPQVWVYDMERGGDARQITDRDEGVSDFDWSPDSGRIVIAARDPDRDDEAYLEQVRDDGPIEIERLQHKQDGEGWLDEVRSYLFVVDVESREAERLDDTGFPPNANDGLRPAWGPDGRIAFRGFDPEAFDCDPDDTNAQDLYTIGSDGGDRRRITDGELAIGIAEWGPNGERLAFSAGDPENPYRPTEAYVCDTDADEYRSVSGELDRTLATFGGLCWLDDSSLLTLIGDEGRTRFARLRIDGEPERVFEAQGEFETIQGMDLAADSDRLACAVARPGEGKDLHAFDAADLTAGTDERDPRTRLTELNPDLIENYDQPACTRETFTVESEGEDPIEVESIVYHPPDFEPGEDEPLPLVLDIHGGPMFYDAPRWKFSDLFWTTRGYAVSKVNYRGSNSYGQDFCEALRGRWNSVEVDDLLAGTDAAVERGYADPDRLFVTGISQGGINTAYLVTRTDRFAAAAPEHGIYDIRSSFGTDDSHNWLESDFGLPWANPEAYESASSIDDVGEIDTPTLITAGENDWRCPPTQAEQFYVSLRKRGVDAKLVVYQNEHHNVSDPDRAIHRLEELESWFRAHDPAVDEPDESEDEGDGSEDGMPQ
jgi:dipeptidyl aminopeptidase/acylaminoacyl peptidase